MSNERIKSQIQFQIQQIDKLLKMYNQLLKECREKEPDLVEITAIASVLHSFYNGLENIFEIIAKRIDNGIIQGEQWHKRLLSEMVSKNDKRSVVISNDLKDKLIEYMGFRHFFRHSYSFFLDWDELKKLVLPLEEVWKQAKGEIEVFLDSIDKN